MTESKLAQKTRRSIRQNFPLGSIFCHGHDNPVTLHDVDDQLFAAVWSLMAETMCVTMELSRTTKEAVAKLVSERNDCPVCIKAHTLCSVLSMVVDTQEQQLKTKGSKGDSKRDRQHEQALQYAEVLLDELKRCRMESCGSTLPSCASSVNSGSNSNSKKSRKKKQYPDLNKSAKAEVALVVMFYDHMNRIVSVIMGDEMSTAMFSVPRSLAQSIEKPSTIRTVAKWMAPFLSATFKAKHEPGLTRNIFPSDETPANPLPSQLQGLLLAGPERAVAVHRLVQWVERFQEFALKGIVSPELISFLEREIKVSHVHSNLESPQDVLQWVENTVGDEISAELKELESDACPDKSKAIVMVLLLASFAPQTAYQSQHWYDLVDHVGQSMARSIVAWWSLRCAFEDAQGLDAADTKVDAATMIKLLSG